MKKLKIVIFSGGRGTASITKSLLRHTETEITLLVNAYDDGLSTGALRKFVPGMLGPSDIRKNIVNLLDDRIESNRIIRRVLEFRFPNNLCQESGKKSLRQLAESYSTGISAFDEIYELLPLGIATKFSELYDAFLNYDEESNGFDIQYADMCVGNIILTGAYLICNRDFNKSIELISDILPLSGKVLNITDGENLVLIGLKEDGTILKDESQIVDSQNSALVSEIYLHRNYLSKKDIDSILSLSLSKAKENLRKKEVFPKSNNAAVKAIQRADIIIYGAGTQHSSLLPSYMTHDIGEAIQLNEDADKIFLGNIRKDQEIQNETCQTLIEKLLYYLGQKHEICEWEKYITHFFIQRNMDIRSQNYIPFDQNLFKYPLDKVVLTNFEDNPGKHSGSKVVAEITRIVNHRVDQRLTPYPHRVTIVVPGLNESRTLGKVLEDLSLLDLHSLKMNKEIIYVDGGSIDNSLNIAHGILGVKVVYLSSKEPRGRGAALRKGIDLATGNIILFFPSDGEYNVNDLKPILHQIIRDEFKVIFGSRAIKCVNMEKRIKSLYKGDYFGYFASKWGGIAIGIVSLLLFNRYVSDSLSGVKAFDAKLLKSLFLQCNGLDLDLEIIGKLERSGVFILEVPIDYFPRTKKQGKKTTTLDGIKALLELVANKYRPLPSTINLHRSTQISEKSI